MRKMKRTTKKINLILIMKKDKMKIITLRICNIPANTECSMRITSTMRRMIMVFALSKQMNIE